MLKLKETWNRMSLKRKIVVMTFYDIALIVCVLFFSSIILNSVLNDYERNMSQSSICYDLQEAIQNESVKFLAYTRERSAQNKEEMKEAFQHTKEIVYELPFDYLEIGEKRYAITWSIRNGYEGYKEYRDQFLMLSQQDEKYVEKLYQVIGIQEDLASYALRLVEATLEQGNQIYEQKEFMFKTVPWVVTIVVSFSTIIVLLYFYKFAKQIVEPLVEMAKDSRKIAEHEFQTPEIITDREDEIGELIHAFNKMKLATGDYIYAIERLHEEEVKNIEKEQRLEDARLEVLKSQVNPHFLFNTLNMISCMAKIEEADLTDKMIISLSNLFRYNLRTVEQEVYLEQELEVLDDYIYIQQMRFDNRIQYRKVIEVDENVVKIPSFTLQPIVENAFIHGLSSREQGGKVELHVWMEGMNLMLSITDNGAGMSKERLKEIQEKLCSGEEMGRGIGVGNISRRIRMLYESGKFEIDSEENRGTVVTITIPQEVVKGEVEHV